MIWSIKIKTHSREEITELPELNTCVIHGCKPKIYKMVVGKRKETYFTASCQHDDCGKITRSVKEVVDSWNKWNPVRHDKTKFKV